MYTLIATHKPYCIFKFTKLSTQILVHSYTWPHFQLTVLLNLMFTMLSTKISCKTIFIHNVDFKSDYKPYIIFEITMLNTQILFNLILGHIFISLCC